jgi:hypothetical protein
MNKNVRKTRIRKFVIKKQERKEVNEGTARNYRTKKKHLKAKRKEKLGRLLKGN